MCLRVINHLDSVLDRAQQPIRRRKLVRGKFINPVCSAKRVNRVERCRNSHRRIASAVDHLLDLDEELDLANTTAPALQIITGPDMSTLSEVITNSCRDLAHILDHSKARQRRPDKGWNGTEKRRRIEGRR